MNRLIFISKVLLVIVVAAFLVWLNLYQYETAGQSTIYRINRITHQAYVNYHDDGWLEIKENPKKAGLYDDLLNEIDKEK